MFQIITNSSISHLRGELFELFLNIQQLESNFHRLETLHIYVDPPSPALKFLSTVYRSTVYSNQLPGTTVLFSKPIALEEKAEIAPISGMREFDVVPRGTRAVDVMKTMEEGVPGTRIFYLGAFQKGKMIAQTKVIIDVIESGDSVSLLKSPKSTVAFEAPLPADSLVFDVEKRNISEPLLFHLEEPSRFFQIGQLSGRVTTVLPVGYGIYHIHIVARNQKKQRSDSWLEINIRKPLENKKSRSRRHLDDLIFRIPENATKEEIQKKKNMVGLAERLYLAHIKSYQKGVN
uniref:VIT domain-containing protein n=1 Tax=Caenorhabditis tropicalis TaxID=1561998 RepID=A0A1I7V164_9PELO